MMTLFSSLAANIGQADRAVRPRHRRPCMGGEDFLYGFKGARSAPSLGWQLRLDRRRTTQALAQARRSSRPAAWPTYNRGALARRAPPTALGTPCHSGDGALQAPEPAAASGPPQQPAPSTRPARVAILPAI
jgi:hypothetical protein